MNRWFREQSELQVSVMRWALAPFFLLIAVVLGKAVVGGSLGLGTALLLGGVTYGWLQLCFLLLRTWQGWKSSARNLLFLK